MKTSVFGFVIIYDNKIIEVKTWLVMRNPYNCAVCGKIVDPRFLHPAYHKTCGSLECQATHNKRAMKKCDQLRQQKHIQELMERGVEMVTCEICKQSFQILNYHHLKIHGLTLNEYKKLYPNSPTINNQSKETRGKGSIAQSSYLSYQGKQPDSKLCEFLAGCLLGDGNLEKRSNKLNARYNEGGANQQYLQWKYEFLSQYFCCSFNERLAKPHVKTGKRYLNWWIRTTVHPFLTNLYGQWYQDRKIVPESFIAQYLTEFALVVWFYDDGCCSNGIMFYTMSFSLKEVEFLMDLLGSRFDLGGSILKNKNQQFYIRLDAKSRDKFRQIVEKFPINGMEYKLNF